MAAHTLPGTIQAVAERTEPRAQSPLLAVALGPTRVLQSSMALPWQGIVLEKHLSSPGARSTASTNQHVISMFHGAPSRFEYRSFSGEFVAATARQRTIMITPPGPVPDIRLHTSAELTHCALDNDFVHGVAVELGRPVPCPAFRATMEDSSIQRILRLLMDELGAERPLGRLYVDSLAHALAAKYLLAEGGGASKLRSRVTGLTPRILNRVRARIEANLDSDLSLVSLAKECGYSRAHFLRMFRATTGVTPHQYVLDLRLKRAQHCLREAKASIIDVALSCGFSSQAHMTTVFRRYLEMTPGEFRRHA